MSKTVTLTLSHLKPGSLRAQKFPKQLKARTHKDTKFNDACQSNLITPIFRGNTTK